jgi:hypothetical protein
VTGLARRASNSDAYCLELPAGLTTAGEIIMAGLRARPVYFEDLPDRHVFPQPRDRLPLAPESGFDGDGEHLADNVEADLANKLALGDSAAVESCLGRTFRPEREAKVKTDAHRAKVRSMVARELATQAERERRYYYFVLDPEVVPVHGNAAPALKALKHQYAHLDFAVLAFADDLEVLDREEARLIQLRYLLPCAKEAAT